MAKEQMIGKVDTSKTVGLGKAYIAQMEQRNKKYQEKREKLGITAPNSHLAAPNYGPC